VRRIGVQGRWQPLVELLTVYADYLARHLPSVVAESAGDVQFMEKRSMTDRAKNQQRENVNA